MISKSYGRNYSQKYCNVGCIELSYIQKGANPERKKKNMVLCSLSIDQLNMLTNQRVLKIQVDEDAKMKKNKSNKPNNNNKNPH